MDDDKNCINKKKKLKNVNNLKSNYVTNDQSNITSNVTHQNNINASTMSTHRSNKDRSRIYTGKSRDSSVDSSVEETINLNFSELQSHRKNNHEICDAKYKLTKYDHKDKKSKIRNRSSENQKQNIIDDENRK